jgi:ATP-dependent protease ClpP protease subunit
VSRNTPWRTARMQFALSQGRNDWYRIRNQAHGPTQVHIYDEIGYFGVSAMDFVRDLADVTGPIEVHLNSPGGEVFDGITIYNTLLARKDVAVHIDGVAASIASVIAMAGNPVLIARQARLMIHEGFAMAIGNAQDMRDLAEQLDKTSHNIATIYSEHTGRPVDYWRQLMKAETWFDAQEAVDQGLCDRFIDSGAGRPVPVPADTWDMSVFRNGGGPRDAASVPYVGERQARHEPMTGAHRHDHAAYEAGDHDDGMHYHAHTHANDADHHHDHSAEPPGPGGPANNSAYGDLETETINHFLAAEVSVLNWDAAAALAKCKSASDYRLICAGEHTKGEPDSSSHWALPHHNSPGAGPDKGGVVAALGRWNQTQDLKNKQAALAHLKAHARALGLPSGDDLDPTTVYSEADAEQFINALKGAST